MKRPEARRRTRVPVAEAEGAPYLVFDVDGEECALPLLSLRRVVRIDALVVPPQAPPALRGLMSLQGEPIVIVELAVALGGPASPHSPESCALVTSPSHVATTSVGLAIDAVSRVVDVAPMRLAPAPRLGTLVDAQLVAAMAHVGERFVPILDIDRLLAMDEVRAAIDAGMASAGTGDGAPARTGEK